MFDIINNGMVGGVIGTVILASIFIVIYITTPEKED